MAMRFTTMTTIAFLDRCVWTKTSLLKNWGLQGGFVHLKSAMIEV
jgi:hypothetical protein